MNGYNRLKGKPLESTPVAFVLTMSGAEDPVFLHSVSEQIAI